MSNLIILSLHHNSIDTFPSELYKLHNLEKLYLGDNKLDTFPLGLLNMPKLKELCIFYNNFKVVPKFDNVNDLDVVIF